jgi:hypothetical protein
MSDKSLNESKTTHLQWQKHQQSHYKELQIAYFSKSRKHKDFENLLKYDFDANSPNSDQAVLRLFNAIIKEPEFQLI